MAAAAAAADMAAALEEARLRQLDSEEARQVAEALLVRPYYSTMAILATVAWQVGEALYLLWLHLLWLH